MDLATLTYVVLATQGELDKAGDIFEAVLTEIPEIAVVHVDALHELRHLIRIELDRPRPKAEPIDGTLHKIDSAVNSLLNHMISGCRSQFDTEPF